MKSDLKRIDSMRDEDIDYSDIPEVTSEMFEGGLKVSVSIPAGEHHRTVITWDPLDRRWSANSSECPWLHVQARTPGDALDGLRKVLGDVREWESET